MNAKTCVNCPGATDHDTAHCPLRVINLGSLNAEQRLTLARDNQFKQAEGAQREREALNAGLDAEFPPLPYSADQRDIDRRNAGRCNFARGWQARTVLAQPSTRKSHVAEALRAADWSNTCIGNKALIEAAIEHLEAQPSPAPETVRDRETPETVAFIHERTGAVANAEMVRTMEEGSVPSGYTIALMAISQHDRMSQERWQYFRRKMQQMRDLMRGMRDRLNAAQARVAELEKQEPVAFVVDVQGYKRLICASREEADSNAEHFEKRGRKSPITALYAAPVAQAGQVPEVSGIGRDADHPRAVVLYLRKEPTDDDLRAIQGGLRSLAAAPQPGLPAKGREGWTLDSPAKVGSVNFHAGVPARVVIEAAQRAYAYSQEPDVEQERGERLKTLIAAASAQGGSTDE